MNIKKTLLGLIFLGTVNTALFGLEVQNNTRWNIKYKIAEAGDNRAGTIKSEKVLLAGQTIQIVPTMPFSIRRSGMGSSVVSSWTEVPVMEIWRRDIGRTPSAYSETYKETLIIESGYTGGWSFKMVAQR